MSNQSWDSVVCHLSQLNILWSVWYSKKIINIPGLSWGTLFLPSHLVFFLLIQTMSRRKHLLTLVKVIELFWDNGCGGGRGRGGKVMVGGLCQYWLGTWEPPTQSWLKTISCWFGEPNVDNIVTILNLMININPQQNGPTTTTHKTTLIDHYGLPILNERLKKTKCCPLALILTNIIILK
jgi:hypothetical protein